MAKITVHGGPSSRYDPPVPPRPRARDAVPEPSYIVGEDGPELLLPMDPPSVEPEVMAAVVASFGQHEVMAPPVEPEPEPEPEPEFGSEKAFLAAVAGFTELEGGEQPSAGSSSETSTASTPRKSAARKANRPQPAPATESP